MKFIRKQPLVVICFWLLCQLTAATGITQVYTVVDGSIHFRSEARLELIKAESTELKGKLDVVKKTFAFGVKMKSFNGFNSPLQKEHFNENYLETSQYPDAFFSGKIIEDIDFDTDGTYSIRAKGNLLIHGILQERIIKSTLTIKKGTVQIDTDFSVQLNDHNIAIPKIVHENLASEIKVKVSARLQK